jgi:hypothetical protein
MGKLSLWYWPNRLGTRRTQRTKEEGTHATAEHSVDPALGPPRHQDEGSPPPEVELFQHWGHHTRRGIHSGPS